MLAYKAKSTDAHFRWLKTGSMWTVSVFLAVILNMALFSLMPRLFQSHTDHQPKLEKIQTVNFIRMKPKEIPPKPKKEKKEPEEQKPKEKENIAKSLMSPPKPTFKKVELPIELNPRLPMGQMALPVPDIKSISVDVSGMKEFYGIGEIDYPLTPLVQMHPIYPMMAKRQGIEGWVKVKFLVAETGRVEQISIMDAQPEDIFDNAVKQCVNAWRFKPGTVEGVPVKVWAETIIRFELE
ncbi:MAG: TonB family protein [Desulfobacterales bacterium]